LFERIDLPNDDPVTQSQEIAAFKSIFDGLRSAIFALRYLPGNPENLEALIRRNRSIEARAIVLVCRFALLVIYPC